MLNCARQLDADVEPIFFSRMIQDFTALGGLIPATAVAVPPTGLAVKSLTGTSRSLTRPVPDGRSNAVTRMWF